MDIKDLDDLEVRVRCGCGERAETFGKVMLEQTWKKMCEKCGKRLVPNSDDGLRALDMMVEMGLIGKEKAVAIALGLKTMLTN